VTANAAESFREQQQRYPRVRAAYERKEAALRTLFEEKRAAWPPQRLFLRVFKAEVEVEAWAATEDRSDFVLVKRYPLCSSSGSLGPKRREGDLQVPEGFYTISGFNPNSNYYLSLRLDYPNASDRLLGHPGRLGGDIFIHGRYGPCLTLGCLPTSNDDIEELYVLAVEARAAGQGSIAVHIFPTRLTEENLGRLRAEFADPLIRFWEGLQPAYEFFERERRLPAIRVTAAGDYRLGP